MVEVPSTDPVTGFELVPLEPLPPATAPIEPGLEAPPVPLTGTVLVPAPLTVPVREPPEEVATVPESDPDPEEEVVEFDPAVSVPVISEAANAGSATVSAATTVVMMIRVCMMLVELTDNYWERAPKVVE
jgi:hypothetical protein